MATMMPVSAFDPLLIRRNAWPPGREPLATYLAGLAPPSRRATARFLDTVAAVVTVGRADATTLDWSHWLPHHTHALRAALVERYAPATVEKMLSAVRALLKVTWRQGWLADDAYRRAVDLRTLHWTMLARRHPVTTGELQAVLAGCAADPTPGGVRDTALLTVLYEGGLRPAEVVGLDARDYDGDRRVLTIRAGEGRRTSSPALLEMTSSRDRVWLVTDGADAALCAWLAVRGTAAGPLFVTVKKAGRVTATRLPRQTVRQILLKRAARAGVRRCETRDLRRLFFAETQERARRAGAPAGDRAPDAARTAGELRPVPDAARATRRGEGPGRLRSSAHQEITQPDI
jgi:integrase